MRWLALAGKAALELYRKAGGEVVAVLRRGGVCERASVDECYVGA